MKYNWSAVVSEFRTILLQNVTIVGNDAAHTADLVGYFRMMVRETDTFHPFGTDGDLCRALEKMPKRCDYRSIKSYWAWKRGRVEVEDAIFLMFDECQSIILDYFKDGWNFPPGYKEPTEITFGWDEHFDLAEKSFARIIKAAKRP